MTKASWTLLLQNKHGVPLNLLFYFLWCVSSHLKFKEKKKTIHERNWTWTSLISINHIFHANHYTRKRLLHSPISFRDRWKKKLSLVKFFFSLVNGSSFPRLLCSVLLLMRPKSLVQKYRIINSDHSLRFKNSVKNFCSIMSNKINLL